MLSHSGSSRAILSPDALRGKRMLGRCIFAISMILSVAGCGFFGPGTVPQPPPLPTAAADSVAVTHTVLHKADYNIDDSETFKRFVVLDDETRYRAELSRYSVEVPKSVDFSTQRVILVTMGTQPSGGFAIGVESVVESDDIATVTVLLRNPGPGCIHTEALSNPYEFALVETTQEIAFEEVSTTVQCE